MHPPTLVFYAFASLCLGALSATTGPAMIADVILGNPALIPTLTNLWSVGTLVMAAGFLMWAALTHARGSTE